VSDAVAVLVTEVSSKVEVSADEAVDVELDMVVVLGSDVCVDEVSDAVAVLVTEVNSKVEVAVDETVPVKLDKVVVLVSDVTEVVVEVVDDDVGAKAQTQMDVARQNSLSAKAYPSSISTQLAPSMQSAAALHRSTSLPISTQAQVSLQTSPFSSGVMLFKVSTHCSYCPQSEATLHAVACTSTSEVVEDDGH